MDEESMRESLIALPYGSAILEILLRQRRERVRFHGSWKGGGGVDVW
jgi:hypothetical protein